MSNKKTINIKLNNLYNDIDDIIKKRQFLESETAKLNKVSELIKKLKHNYIIESDIIDYDLIDSIWLDYVSSKFNIKNTKNENIVNIAGKDMTSSCLLENIFTTYIDSQDEDLVMIYKKGAPEIIYYIKSYQIINKNKISLPYHRIVVPVHTIQVVFDEQLYDDEILVSCI